MADLLAEEGAQGVSSSHSRVRRSEMLQGAYEGVAELLVRVLDDEVRTGVQACTILRPEVDPIPCAEPVRSSLDLLHVGILSRRDLPATILFSARNLGEWPKLSSIALCTFWSRPLRDLAIRLTLVLLSLSSLLSESWSAAAAAGCSAALALGGLPLLPAMYPRLGCPQLP